MFRTDISEQSYNFGTIVDICHFWHGSKSDWNPIDSKDRYFLKIEGNKISQYKNVAVEKWSLKKDLVFSREYQQDNVVFRVLLPVEDLDTPIGELHFHFFDYSQKTTFLTGYEPELYFNKINHDQAIQYKIWFLRYLIAPKSIIELPEIVFRIEGYGQVRFTPYVNRFVRIPSRCAHLDEFSGLTWFGKTE